MAASLIKSKTFLKGTLLQLLKSHVWHITNMREAADRAALRLLSTSGSDVLEWSFSQTDQLQTTLRAYCGAAIASAVAEIISYSDAVHKCETRG